MVLGGVTRASGAERRCGMCLRYVTKTWTRSGSGLSSAYLGLAIEALPGESLQLELAGGEGAGVGGHAVAKMVSWPVGRVVYPTGEGTHTDVCGNGIRCCSSLMMRNV